MARAVDFLMQADTVVAFDIDGVLAPYEFTPRCHSVIDDDEWFELVRTGDPYGSLPPVKLIQRMIDAKEPDNVYVVSVSSPDEYQGKQCFVTKNYHVDPAHIRFVDSKAAKLDALVQIAQERHVPQEQVAMVEDTVKTLDMIARSSSFATIHVSSLFAFDECREL